MPAQKSPQDAAAKWGTNLANAIPLWEKGVQGVQTAPNTLAAAAVDTWAANVAAAKNKYVTRNQGVTLTEWKAAAMATGPSRLAESATAKQNKVVSFMQTFLPFVYQQVASLPPRGTYQQNKQRAVAMMDALHAAAGNF